MIWLTVGSLLVFLYMLYHVHTCEKDINCLSDIAYDKHTRLFPLCILTMILLLIPGMFLQLHSLWWVAIIAGLSLIGVILTPYKDSKVKYKIHMSCALLSMISVVCLWVIKGYWFIPFLFCVASLRKNWLLGLEMGLLSSIFLYNLI